MSNALNIVGSKRIDGVREINDFYPTPPSATISLLKREKFIGDIWEPACGDGAISKVLIESGYKTYSTDLIDRNYGKVSDFLLPSMFNGEEKHDNIITNPPFKNALDFVLQAKKMSNNKIAMFLKTVFLESTSRYKMFQDTNFPLKTVYQFSKRVTLKDKTIETDSKISGLIAYAWFVWDKNYKGKPTIEWIND